MKIDFNTAEEKAIEGFYGGTGIVYARIVLNEMGKILIARLPEGSSIGLHTHEKNCEIEFIVQGRARAVCDGSEELLSAGMCHYCPKGSSHIMENAGKEDLLLYAVVPEQP